jgi:cellulose synthase operon protein C
MTISTASLLVLVTFVLVQAAGCGDKSDADAMAAAKQALTKGDHAAAVVELKSALQRSPNLGEARYLLGLALFEQGNCPAALLELGKARDLGFDENLLAPKLARCLLTARRYKEVIQTYAVSELKPPSAQAEVRTAVALAHIGLNQVQEGEAALASALKADPKFLPAHLARARLLAASGKFDEALALVDQALKSGGSNGEAHLLRGLLLRFGKKDVDGAISAFQAAALNPLLTLEARSALVQVYLSQQRLPEAKAELALLQKAHPKKSQTYFLDAIVSYASKDYAHTEAITDQLLGVAPGNPQLLVLGGAASLQRGNLIAAETKLGKAVQTVEQMTVARKLLAETYLRMGRPEQALAKLQPLLTEARPDGDVLAMAGNAYLQSGNAQEAESMFSGAVKLKPQDVQSRTALALTNLVKGNAEAAFDALQTIAAKDPGETADLALISAHLRRSEFDAALKAIDRLERKRPGATSTAMLRGAALKGLGDTAGARATFESVLKSEPRHVAAIGSLVKLDLDERQFEAARSRLQALIDASPRDSLPRLMMLEVRERQGAKPPELMSVVDQALQANSEDASAYMAKMALQGQIGDAKGAASTAQLAMSRISGNASLLDAAGRALVQAGDYQQAINVFNQLAQLWPRSPTPFLRQVELHTRRGDSAAAKASLARAFEVDPQSPDVIDQYLAESARSRDPKRALEAARQLQRRFSSKPVGWAMEGDIFAQRKEWSSALAAYRAATAKTESPGPLPRRIHALVHVSQGTAASDRFAAEWLTTHPKDVAFREYLGSQAIVTKNFPLAEQRFREVLEVAPNSLVAVNNLAWLLAERGDKQAVEMARRALSRAPRSATVLDTLAKALASQGDVAGAVSAQRDAVRLQPDRASYLVSLVELLIRMGDKDAARQQLAELEKLSVGSTRGREVVADLRRKLAS